MAHFSGLLMGNLYAKRVSEGTVEFAHALPTMNLNVHYTQHVDKQQFQKQRLSSVKRCNCPLIKTRCHEVFQYDDQGDCKQK